MCCCTTLWNQYCFICYFQAEHDKCKCHQNKCSVLSGCAAERWDPCNNWRLSFFLQDSAPTGPHGPWDGRVTAARGFVFHCLQSVTSQQPQPQPCWPQGVGYDEGPCLLGEVARRRRSEVAFDWRMGQSGAKRHRWHDRPVAFTTSCPCGQGVKRGTLWTVFVTCIWTSS